MDIYVIIIIMGVISFVLQILTASSKHGSHNNDVLHKNNEQMQRDSDEMMRREAEKTNQAFSQGGYDLTQDMGNSSMFDDSNNFGGFGL